MEWNCNLKSPPPVKLEGIISAIDYKLIDEVNVQLSNAPAEYPNTTGGIIELKTKNAPVKGHSRIDLNFLHIGAFYEKQWRNINLWGCPR